MDNKYDEVMEHLEVTPEMRQRILNKLQQTELPEKKPAGGLLRSPRKRLAALAACLAVALAGVLTLPHLLQAPHDPDVLAPGDGIVEAVSAEALSDELGFDVADLHTLPFAIEDAVYTAYWKELAEIVYSGQGQTAVYRIGPGTEDVSGDYSLYGAKTALTADGLTVELKGDSGEYTLATWTDGAFSYSLSLSEGLTEPEWQAIFTGQP